MQIRIDGDAFDIGMCVSVRTLCFAKDPVALKAIITVVRVSAMERWCLEVVIPSSAAVPQLWRISCCAFAVVHLLLKQRLVLGSLLTWRERAELADFLEGAGALLVQQLDVLQAKRRSSAGAEGARGFQASG
eukprot:1161098-Pelagomonas_calceolata.AAC.3